jgi:hypothetical protein
MIFSTSLEGILGLLSVLCEFIPAAKDIINKR